MSKSIKSSYASDHLVQHSRSTPWKPSLRHLSTSSKVKMDVKKKSHISSELRVIKDYLFKGRLTDHSSLPKLGTATESHSPKREQLCA